ncbi:MAG: hypothetical protein ACR2MP_12230 [Streptosporangiaceae bacterium]
MIHALPYLLAGAVLLVLAAAAFSHRPEPAERLHAFGELLVELVRAHR